MEKQKWSIEFNDGDVYPFSTKDLLELIKSYRKVKNIHKILNNTYYPFNSGCCICNSFSELFSNNDMTYCRKHYIAELEARLRYAMEE
jgi:hypothetical protein